MVGLKLHQIPSSVDPDHIHDAIVKVIHKGERPSLEEEGDDVEDELDHLLIGAHLGDVEVQAQEEVVLADVDQAMLVIFVLMHEFVEEALEVEFLVEEVAGPPLLEQADQDGEGILEVGCVLHVDYEDVEDQQEGFLDEAQAHQEVGLDELQFQIAE